MWRFQIHATSFSERHYSAILYSVIYMESHLGQSISGALTWLIILLRLQSRIFVLKWLLLAGCGVLYNAACKTNQLIIAILDFTLRARPVTYLGWPFKVELFLARFSCQGTSFHTQKKTYPKSFGSEGSPLVCKINLDLSLLW